MPGEVIRRATRPTVERDCFRVPLSRPGILEIYGSTGLRSERIRTRLLSADVPEGTESPWQVRYRTPREWVVDVSGAGDAYLAVESEIPGRPVPDYALSIHFADADAVGAALLAGLTKDVDPWDDDGTSGFAGETAEGDPFGLCTQGDESRPVCAVPISAAQSSEILGEIEPGGESHLTFGLDDQETIMLDLGEGSEAGMLLFDSRGHALESASTDLLVRTLGAGRYYVLLTAADGAASGSTAYRLWLDRVP